LITHRADGGNRTLDASSLVVLTDSGFAMYCQCMSDRLTKKRLAHSCQPSRRWFLQLKM